MLSASDVLKRAPPAALSRYWHWNRHVDPGVICPPAGNVL